MISARTMHLMIYRENLLPSFFVHTAYLHIYVVCTLVRMQPSSG